jgi:catechol 2,3-dioxygenase-like lactoylglutathione lyase family enzyme
MQFDRITRRDALFVLGAAAAPRAHAEGGLLRATRVDHVSLAVGDIDKALLFYRRLFGNEVLKDNRTPRRYLRLGPCYMAVAPAAAGEGRRIDHFGIGIENFAAPAIKSSLDKNGFQVRESDMGLYLTDPSGNSLQLWADQSWKQLSNAAPDSGPAQQSLLHPRGMHHVAIQTNGMAPAAEFYQKLFGEPVAFQGDPPQPSFLAGETRIVLYNPSPTKPAKIDHFSVLVENFDAPSTVETVKALGAKVAVSRQGTMDEFFDPEGIRLQVTFPGQVYGSTPVQKK